MEFLDVLHLDIITKLALATLFGGLIGLEREVDGNDAGVRTHMLVCVGSAIFAAVSFATEDGGYRIAGAIVSGIGFLGAGAIFKSKYSIASLTTAADLWVVAAIGLCLGFGFIDVATVATILVLLLLLLKYVPFYDRLKKRNEQRSEEKIKETVELEHKLEDEARSK